MSYCDWDNVTVLGVCCRQMHVLPGYVFAVTEEVLVECAGSVSRSAVRERVVRRSFGGLLRYEASRQ